MSNKRLPILMIIIVALAVIGFGAYYFYFMNMSQRAASGVLTAFGTVESTEISIAPETSGKVLEVLVDDGNLVKSGDVLFRLDDSLLQAQKDVAAASLSTVKAAASTAQAAIAAAQAQYDLTFSSAMVQDRTNRSQDWYKTQSGDFTLPPWYYNQQEQITAAQAVVALAQANLTKAQGKLDNQMKTSGADFVKAGADLATAQADYQVAKNLNDRISKGVDSDDLTRRQLFLLQKDAYLESKDVEARWMTTLVNAVNKDLRDEAQNIYDDAKSNLEDAQEAYDDALTTDGAKDVLKARAQVSIAEERYYTALDFVRILQTGSEAQTVTAAAKALEQAKSAAAQAQVAISQAEANLALIEAQLAKSVVTAPADGVVLTRNVEPGEVVNPGSIVLTIGKIADLTLTVYVPEDRYGEVSLGQQVSVSVDSFPGETFTATVTHISDQAEFTPRNVQTVEGRKTTVFAIQLKLTDPEAKLKPGMPADVTFK